MDGKKLSAPAGTCNLQLLAHNFRFLRSLQKLAAKCLPISHRIGLKTIRSKLFNTITAPTTATVKATVIKVTPTTTEVSATTTETITTPPVRPVQWKIATTINPLCRLALLPTGLPPLLLVR